MHSTTTLLIPIYPRHLRIHARFCRCHNKRRTSRSSVLGRHRHGNRPLKSSSSSSPASRASVFCFRTSAARMRAVSPTHNSCLRSASRRSTRACVGYLRFLPAPARPGAWKAPLLLLWRDPGDLLSTRPPRHPAWRSAGSGCVNHNLQLHVLGSFSPSLGSERSLDDVCVLARCFSA